MIEYWFERIIRRLEQRWAKFSVRNLILYIVGLNLFVYILSAINPNYISSLTFDLVKIFQGQVWRMVTYIFIPPPSDPLFMALALYFIYLIGSALEAAWGSFRLNLYYLIGMIGTTIVGFIFPQAHISNVYLNTSLFLAFAALYPEFLVYIFFIIPVKVKYLAILVWLGIFYVFLFFPLPVKITQLAAVLNYILFFWPIITQNAKIMGNSSKKIGVVKQKTKDVFHRCFVCGKTEHDGDDLKFRVCVQCSQGKEYCQQHLPEHKHN